MLLLTDDRDLILAHVTGLLEPILNDVGVELVDIELLGGRGRALLRILIDKPGRVFIEDCVKVNRAFSGILDVEDPIPYPYTLEVCSPGLDRPFKTHRDFERSIGYLVKVYTTSPVDGVMEHSGRLVSCDERQMILCIGEDVREIPFETVQKALKEVVWESS